MGNEIANGDFQVANLDPSEAFEMKVSRWYLIVCSIDRESMTKDEFKQYEGYWHRFNQCCQFRP